MLVFTSMHFIDIVVFDQHHLPIIKNRTKIVEF